jgi:hypothetical protein
VQSAVITGQLPGAAPTNAYLAQITTYSLGFQTSQTKIFMVAIVRGYCAFRQIRQLYTVGHSNISRDVNNITNDYDKDGRLAGH